MTLKPLKHSCALWVTNRETQCGTAPKRRWQKGIFWRIIRTRNPLTTSWETVSSDKMCVKGAVMLNSQATPGVFLACLVLRETTLPPEAKLTSHFQTTRCLILSSRWIQPLACSTCPRCSGAQRIQSGFLLVAFNVVSRLRSEAMHFFYKIV